jgi:hypothetical protein
MVVPSPLIVARNSAAALLLVDLLLVGGTSPSPRIWAEMAMSSSLALVVVGREPKDTTRSCESQADA